MVDLWCKQSVFGKTFIQDFLFIMTHTTFPGIWHFTFGTPCINWLVVVCCWILNWEAGKLLLSPNCGCITLKLHKYTHRLSFVVELWREICRWNRREEGPVFPLTMPKSVSIDWENTGSLTLTPTRGSRLGRPSESHDWHAGQSSHTCYPDPDFCVYNKLSFRPLTYVTLSSSRDSRLTVPSQDPF